MNNQGIHLNTPKDISHFKGQFVVFFSEDADPKVIFNSFIAEEAYKKAQDIKDSEGREPVVYRVQESEQNNIAQVLALRF